MGDYFSPPPGYPPPPPEPDIPPPNLADIGLNWAVGVAKSGALGGFWAGLRDALVSVFGFIVGWVVRIIGDILAFVIQNISAADEVAGPGYANLVAAELESLFGISYSSAALQGIANAKNRADLGTQVGNFMLQSIFAPSSNVSGSGITPSDAGPRKFLGAVMTMEVEGWLHSWLFDALSYHELEKFGDLKDGIARVLGLGRLSRQVFAPPLKVFVHDPYLQLLNATYRPTQLPHTSAIKQYQRGAISRQQLSDILGRQGWSEQYIEYLINELQKYLSDADVDYLIKRGTWNQDQGVKYLAEQGWDTATATERLSILHDQRIDKYRQEILRVGEEAFVRGDVPFDQWQNIVTSSGLSDDDQTWILRVAGVKRELHVTHLSRGDIETGIKKGILNFNDLQAWAVRNNMPIDEERFLELIIAEQEAEASARAQKAAAAAQAKSAAAQAKQTAAAAKAAAAKAQAPDKGISVSQAETLVIDGIWTFDHLTAYLTARNYSPDAIAAITTLLHDKMAKATANGTAAPGIRATAAAKGLNLAQAEKAVVLGILTIGNLQQFLAAHGFTDADAQVIVELTEHAIELQQAKDSAAAARAAKAGIHEPSLATIEKAVRLGITPLATYTAALQQARFDAAGIALLEGILQSQMAADKASAAKRAAAAAAAGTKGVSLADLEREVIAGIRPIGDFTAQLAQLCYDVTDQQDLTQLLQLRVDQALHAADKRLAAGTEFAQRGLSLTDIERAVKLGVASIDDYKAALAAAHFDTHSIDVLSHTLLAQVAKTAGAQQTTNGAAKTAKAKGISLANEQKAVLEGIKSIDDYKALLTGLNYSAGDVATMAELLQMKIEQAAAAAARHADAEGKATERGISLANEEAAVVAGDKTMANYDAMLTALGYDAVDRAVLESLLQAKIAAKAAKAGSSAAGSGAGSTSGSGTTGA